MESQLKPASTSSHDEPEARGPAGVIWAVLSGLVLIAIGIILILNNAGLMAVTFLANWWALFILIPAVGAFIAAFEHWRRDGQFDHHVISNVIGGLILTFVACMFLFNLNWGVWWPVFIILAGLGALSRALVRERA